MFERFKRDEAGGRHGRCRAARHGHRGPSRRARRALRVVRARQREEFGGVNWGAAFFGWLVAIGLGALLVGLLAAAGAAVGLTDVPATDTAGTASEIGIGGAIALLAALAVAYFFGGYVAGRMSRFDGARQGMGAWLIGLIVTVVLADRRRPARRRVQRRSSGSTCRRCRSATRARVRWRARRSSLVLARHAARPRWSAARRASSYHRKVDRAGFRGLRWRTRSGRRLESDARG